MNTDLYTIFESSSYSRLSGRPKPVKETYKFLLPDGTTGTTVNKSELFRDEVTGNTLSRNYNNPVTVWHNGKMVTSILSSNMKNIKVSKYYSLPTTDATIFFKEHSGSSFGGVKKFTKPTGSSFGVEIELAFKGDSLDGIANKLIFSQWIAENYPEWITERDGSLEDWCHANDSSLQNSCLELVSPPLTFTSLSKDIPIILAKVKELNGFIPSEWFGIHITSNIYGRHIKKSAVKFIKTVHASELNRFWKLISMRAGSDSLKKFAWLHRYSNISDEDLIEFCLSDHYRAVFPRNSSGGALETRIFKSTVEPHILLSILELTMLLTQFSLSTEEHWLKYLSANSSRLLLDFIDFCGLSSMMYLDNERDEAA